jgi:hypothetical protein
VPTLTNSTSWLWLTVAGLLVGIPSLLALDVLLGLVYRTSTHAGVSITLPRSGTARRVIVIFPGYLMPGRLLGDAFAPFVAVDDAIVAVNYPDRGIDILQIHTKVMAALQSLKPDELRVYAASMGGMVAKLFLDCYREAGLPYGKVVVILDTALANRDNVKRPPFLLNMSCWYRGGPLSSALWTAASLLGDRLPMEEDAPQEVVSAARAALGRAGMPAVTSQACFIMKFVPIKEGELADVVRQVTYIHGTSPNLDPLVRISDAIDAWRKGFPGLVVISLRHRSARWHLPLVEYPREICRHIVAAP